MIKVLKILDLIKIRIFLLPILMISLWIIMWWSIAIFFDVSEDFLPTPDNVLARLIRLSHETIGEGTLIVHIIASLKRFIVGFCYALLIGIPLGFLMGYFKFFDKIISPIFEAFRPIPPIAWAPFAILWFGISLGAQSFVIFLTALPPIVINSYLAIKLTDKSLIQAARVMGAKPITILLEVALPSAVPLVFVGLRIGLAWGWMALIAAEIVAADGGNSGLGFLILMGQRTLHADLSIASMIVIGIIGTILDLVLRNLNEYFMRWRSS